MKLIRGKKIYKKGKKNIFALNDISLEFKRGCFYGVMGKSGSGKSTLLHILGLLDNLDEGELYFDNINISILNDIKMSELRKKNIGFVFQSFYLNSNLTALDNVILPMYLDNKLSDYDRGKRAKELLKLVGLENRENHYPKELSGGEEQRVAIARALANNPKYILADEPTGSLDSKSEKVIFDLLLKLKEQGKCIIVVSHDNIIKKYADYIIELSDGRISKKYEIKK